VARLRWARDRIIDSAARAAPYYPMQSHAAKAEMDIGWTLLPVRFLNMLTSLTFSAADRRCRFPSKGNDYGFAPGGFCRITCSSSDGPLFTIRVSIKTANEELFAFSSSAKTDKHSSPCTKRSMTACPKVSPGHPSPIALPICYDERDSGMGIGRRRAISLRVDCRRRRSLTCRNCFYVAGVSSDHHQRPKAKIRTKQIFLNHHKSGGGFKAAAPGHS
jgi:hypothetical protein